MGFLKRDSEKAVARKAVRAEIGVGADAYVTVSRRFDALYVPGRGGLSDPDIVGAFMVFWNAKGGDANADASTAAMVATNAGYTWRLAEEGDLTALRSDLAPIVAAALASAPSSVATGDGARGRLIALAAVAAADTEATNVEIGSPVPPSQGFAFVSMGIDYVFKTYRRLNNFPLDRDDVGYHFMMGMLIHDCAPLVPVSEG